MNSFRKLWLLARGIWACVELVRRPERLELVHRITDALAANNPEALTHLRSLFGRTAVGARALQEKPRLTIDLGQLSRLPEGTLGKVFSDHMLENGLDAQALPETASRVEQPKMGFGDELRFIRAHIYDTHDVWHVVTGFGVDVQGELGLQAFCAAQTPYPLPSLLIGLGCLNTVIYAREELELRMAAISRGWEMGRRALPLFGAHWDELWDSPLEDVRARFQVEAFTGGLSRAA